MNQVLFPIGLLPPMIWMLFSKNLRRATGMTKGSTYAFITGILGGTGNIAFLAAMSRRRDSIRCGSMGRLCAAGDRDNGATAAEGFSRHDALAWDTLLS